MTGPRPPLRVVSLSAETVEEAKLQVAQARDAGGDLAELRLDRWTEEERQRVGHLFPSSIPLLATLRSRAEGGSGPDLAEERRPILAALAESPFAYIDLEASRDRYLEGTVRSLGRVVVRSTHFAEGWSPAAVRARASEARPTDGLLKVVVPATFGAALDLLLPLIESMSSPRPVILTTGPSGALWRSLAHALQIPWVFCALPESNDRTPVEGSQLPVDRVAQVDAVEGAPRFAVVGHPVAHSLSPNIHHAWMRREGRAGLYLRLDLESADEFRRAIQFLPGRGFRGLNVTHPWKHLAYEAAATRSADAIASGTANTLRFDHGTVAADNTDLAAIQRRLVELQESGHWDGAALTVLGGGGAARATLAAAPRLWARASILARRPSAAATLAAEFDARPDASGAPASLVVHATSVGRAAQGQLELPLAPILSARSYVLDWVYGPEDPQVEHAARIAGARYEDGRRLLVYQAAASYLAWWGEAPSPESVESVVQELACAA
jgi:shikimate dehydrogenase/3-dehydroquinate dehydratase type I